MVASDDIWGVVPGFAMLWVKDICANLCRVFPGVNANPPIRGKVVGALPPVLPLATCGMLNGLALRRVCSPIEPQNKKKAAQMQDILQVLIHKAPVQGLLLHIGRSGLCIGDAAELQLQADGRIAIFAQAKRPLLGVLPRRSLRHLGFLGPAATAVMTDPLRHSDHLRVRIVGLTPEHLAPNGEAEVYISVWSNTHRLMAARPPAPLQARPVSLDPFQGS